MMQNFFENWTKPLQMGTHLRVLIKSYPMNTNKQGLDGFQKSLRPCALDESSLSIGRVSIHSGGGLIPKA